MARLTTLLAALYALSSLPLIFAWTFTWRNASDRPTVEEGTGAQPCKAIDQAKGQSFEFNPEDSIVRIYLYASANCSETASVKADDYLSEDSDGPIRGFAVIDLRGANTSTTGELEGFPGADWFKSSPNSPIITAMGTRLVAEGCGKYTEGPGPQWTESDRKSYQCWQEKLGYTGKDADGWPGKTSWDQLKVPHTTSTGSSTATETPSSTSTQTEAGTPTSTSTSDPDPPSGSALGGGEIAGVVVGSVVGLGLIGAIVYLARRVGRRSAPATTEEAAEHEPEGAAGAGGEDNVVGVAVVADESKKPSLEKLPPEADAIAARNQVRHFAELPGDVGTAELSDSRRINELSDSRGIVELGDGRTWNGMRS